MCNISTVLRNHVWFSLDSQNSQFPFVSKMFNDIFNNKAAAYFWDLHERHLVYLQA